MIGGEDGAAEEEEDDDETEDGEAEGDESGVLGHVLCFLTDVGADAVVDTDSDAEEGVDCEEDDVFKVGLPNTVPNERREGGGD